MQSLRFYYLWPDIVTVRIGIVTLAYYVDEMANKTETVMSDETFLKLEYNSDCVFYPCSRKREA
jgi:hypothetical protein